METPTGQSIFTNANMTCKSENLIYCIKCNGCSEIYIGQTGNALVERVRIHRQHIRQPQYRKIPLSKHLDECGGGFFKIFPFYKLNIKCEIKREIKEKHFIAKFKSRLNAKYSFSIV